jgi:hypothetical protein
MVVFHTVNSKLTSQNKLGQLVLLKRGKGMTLATKEVVECTTSILWAQGSFNLKDRTRFGNANTRPLPCQGFPFCSGV